MVVNRRQGVTWWGGWGWGGGWECGGVEGWRWERSVATGFKLVSFKRGLTGNVTNFNSFR